MTEIPPMRLHITEHQVHRLTCTGCGKTTRGALPAGVATSQFGARLSAFIGLLMGSYRLSKRQVCGLMYDSFGVSMSPGSVVNRQQEISLSLAAPVNEVVQQIKQAP